MKQRNDTTGNLPAGGFLSWLARTRRVLLTEGTASVPCGDCRAYCTSFYFIHIKPDETKTLARIPRELLFPAPGLPKGNMLMGYDENGHCPMFTDDKCSIYDHRPQTCRQYDCRVFPAAGLAVDDHKPLILQQARRWKFDFPSTQDSTHFAALRAAAKFLIEHADLFPAGFVPHNASQQAVLAIKIYEVFLNDADDPQSVVGTIEVMQ